MNPFSRRKFLQVAGQAGTGLALSQLPLQQALAAAPAAQDEFFVLIHAAGGWDVTLWSDPRNQRKGLVEPASTDNTDWSKIRLYKPIALDADTNTFDLVTAPNGMVFGPTLGNLLPLASRLTVLNGIAMNTVSHPDGTWFSTTGRHLAGGRPVASSIDTMLSNEFGAAQLFPTVSINYPSSFIGSGLDQRVVPLKIGSIGTIAKSLTRSTTFETAGERDAVTVLLSQEAQDLAQLANDPAPLTAFSSQYDSLRKMLDPAQNLTAVFDQTKLVKLHPELNPVFSNTQQAAAIDAAFAIEAMSRNLVRSVSFATSGSFDTHNTNYKNQAITQQDLFDLLAAFVTKLDATPHPTRTADKLSDHTHILVVSDFCRTPQINLSNGRDHYPNNSALIISPRFKSMVYGKTDLEQLLPASPDGVADPLTPPDVLATFVSAFGIDPRKYLRDGNPIQALLA
jgi:uncharacterized protein (DUF1501 family)